MNTSTIAAIIFRLCILPLLGILTKYIISYLSRKAELAQKYITLVTTIVSDCVMATNQTYVDTLKKEGSFDLEAQKIAFVKTKEAVLSLLAGKAMEMLETLVGDVDVYIDQLIEADVKRYKNY